MSLYITATSESISVAFTDIWKQYFPGNMHVHVWEHAHVYVGIHRYRSEIKFVFECCSTGSVYFDSFKHGFLLI